MKEMEMVEKMEKMTEATTEPDTETKPERKKGIKLKITSKFDPVRFKIAYHDPETDEVSFFGGFCNEVENIGTDDECQCWEKEEWVDIDRAVGWKTFAEAVDTYKVLDAKKRRNGYIALYGYSIVPSVSGEHWFPLKVFLKSHEEVI